VSWDFTARCYASFRGVDQRLPEQRRNRRPQVLVDVIDGGNGLVLVADQPGVGL
jgi:Tfp pilus assembly pilus retraction ATPase PilT